MIEQMTDLPAGVLGFSARGKVTAADLENVVVPDIEAAFALNRKLRLIYHLGPQFSGFDPAAMWDDARLGFRHLSGWERIALVTDTSWLRVAAQAMGFAVPGAFRLFRNAELAEAKRWIGAP